MTVRNGAPSASKQYEDWPAAGPGLPDEIPTPPVDRAEVEGLYRSQTARLRRYLSRRIGNPDDALDLVQDSFARMLGSAANCPEWVARPEAYLQRVARNLLLDRKKMDARRLRHLHVVADEDRIAGADLQRQLESRDMLRRLEAAMLKLKPRTREIFMAHRLDGMSYAEIAERTGLSVKGVEKQMSRAIAQIDRMLGR